MKRLRRSAWIALGVLALALACLRVQTGASGQPAQSPVTTGNFGTALPKTPAPAISLVDQTGAPQTLAAYRGSVVVLTFIDSRCTTTCPLTAQMLQTFQDEIGPQAAGVKLLAVNTNPDATAPADAAAWTAQHGMSGRWLFLTGPAAQLEPIWSAYHIGVEVEDGDVHHTDATYVIDRRGDERWVLSTADQAGLNSEAHALAAAVLPLLK